MEILPKTSAPRKTWLIRAARILICIGLISPLTVNLFLGIVTNYVDEDTSLEWNRPNHAVPHFEKPDAIMDTRNGRRRGLGGGHTNSRKLRLGDGDQRYHENEDGGGEGDNSDLHLFEMAKQIIGDEDFLSDIDEVSRKPCPEVVQYWLEQAEKWNRVNDKPVSISASSPFLWFLHIPRTGGRCMHSCMLKYAKAPEERCVPSYDKFREELYSNCTLLGSHDDYSISRLLHRESINMMTMSRDPVDRVISAYEFAISNANSLRVNQSDQRSLGIDEEALMEIKKPTNDTKGRKSVSTRLVWPWSKLIPLIEQDVVERKAKNRLRSGQSNEDPYNSPHIVMSMREFITHPDVVNLVHNGASLQTLGLTNYSHFDAPHTVRLRECATSDSAAAGLIAEAAKARMRQMSFVGLTSKHKRSAELLAATFNWSLKQEAYPMMPKLVNRPRKNSEKYEPESPKPAMTLGQQYIFCAAKSLEKQNKRRNSPLKSIGSITFDSKSRKAFIDQAKRPAEELSESNPHAGLLDLIRSMNAADAALFDEGQALFDRMEQRYAEEGREIERLPEESDVIGVNELANTKREKPTSDKNANADEEVTRESLFMWIVDIDIDSDGKLNKKEAWSLLQAHPKLADKLDLPASLRKDRGQFKQSFRNKFESSWDANQDSLVEFSELWQILSYSDIS